MGHLPVIKKPDISRAYHRACSEVHDLEPGNSLIFGYPGSEFGQCTFLLAGIYPEDNSVSGLAVNGGPRSSLSKICKGLNLKIDPMIDMPVFYGGDYCSNTVSILTPLHWEPDIKGSFEIGPYRLHTSIDALIAIAEGNIPEKVRFFLGQMGMEMPFLYESIRNNSLGEIIARDDIIFSEDDGVTKWLNALNTYTGGKPLHIPPSSERPSLVLPEGAVASRPAPYMN